MKAHHHCCNAVENYSVTCLPAEKLPSFASSAKSSVALPDSIQLGIKAPGAGCQVQLLVLAGSLKSAASQGLLEPGLPLQSNALLLCLLLGCIVALPLLTPFGVILNNTA